EDGIRDRNVTGVQTCALPIYRERATRRADCAFWLHLLAAPLIVHSLIWLVSPALTATSGAGRGGPSWQAMTPELAAAIVFIFSRSEERRVGKECRSGGS